MTFVLSEASSLVAPVRSAGPVLGRKFLVDVVREPPQLVLLGRQDDLIAQLRVAGCQQLLEVRLDPPSAQPADKEVRQLRRRRQRGIGETGPEEYRVIGDADGCAPEIGRAHV